MRVFFFGCISPDRPGHYLFDADGRQTWRGNPLPFLQATLDTGLLSTPEIKSPQLAVINGYTILGTWDRTGDSRPGSCSSFIAEGVHSVEGMAEIARATFPLLWQRIRLEVPMKTEVAK